MIDIIKVMESDLNKCRTENMKLINKVKEVEEKSILNKKVSFLINCINLQNANNTSSAFSLPSEFKTAWDELMSENLIDAFGSLITN